MADFGCSEDFDFSGYVLDRVETTDYATNWKTFVEVYLECYHVDFLHAGLGNYADCDNYQVRYGEHNSVQVMPAKNGFNAPGTPVYRRWQEACLRQLRGKTDEAANERKRMNDDLSKQIEDLNFKIDNSAAKPGVKPATPGTPAVPAVVTPGTPVAPSGKRTAEAAMQDGNAALARRDYPVAEAAAREVITGPKTPRAYDAQFLLAQALAGKKDNQGAAVAYDDAYNRGRTGARAQDSLLGLANSLTAIGEKRAACATMDKLRAEFPTPRVDLKEQIAAARLRAACH